MSLKAGLRDIRYFDVVVVCLLIIVAAARFAVRDNPASPALLQDATGFWAPLAAAAMLGLFRHRAYTQSTPWIAGAAAALILIATAAVFWRWHVMLFMIATLGAAVLLLAGLVLRTRRLAEPLARADLFGLIALGFSVVLTLTLAEVFPRVAPGLFSEKLQGFLWGADPANFGVAHPYIGHLHTPHNAFPGGEGDHQIVHHVDGLGFRNAWPWPERADIVVIGDSVTFGQNVADDEAWPARLAERAAPSRVINLGLIGAGPEQYLRLSETYGLPLEPRLVLVGVFARNDFWDAGVFGRWLEAGAPGNYMVWRDFGRPEPVDVSLRHPRKILERANRAYVIPAVRRSHLFALVRGLRGGVEADPPPAPRIYRFEDGRSVQLHEADFVAKTRRAQPGERVFELAIASLQQLHARALAHGAHVLMVLLPGKEEVYLPLLGDPTPDPARALRSAMDRLGIEYLDLAPAMRARAAEGEQLFYEVDGHPNPTGQALIARLVHEHLTRHADRYGIDALAGRSAAPADGARGRDGHSP